MYDRSFIQSVIHQGENQNTQLLGIFEADEIERSVCGFLNATGGLLLVGVRADGKVSGVDDAAKKSIFLRKQFIWAIFPEAPVSISVINFQKKSVIAISVFSGSQPPYTSNGIIYIRRRAITIKAVPDDIHQLVAIRGKNELKWERQLCREQQMQEMDEYEIRRSIRNLAASGRGKVFPEAHTEEFLSYYGLMQNRTFSRAAVILFGREPARLFPQCRIRIAIFRGNKTGKSCSFESFLEGHVFRNLDDLKRFFEFNLNTTCLKIPSETSQRAKSLPLEALKETIINAIIHRDYSDISDCIQIDFYLDRLEISNPGIMDIKAQKNPGTGPLHAAANPDLTYLFYIRELVDRAGSGMNKISNNCYLNGFQRPKWQVRNKRTYVIFPGLTLRGNQSELQADKSDEDPRNHFHDGISLLVANRLIDLLGFIHSNRKTKVADLQQKFQLSERSIKTNLKQLTDTGFIQYSGSKKTGSYSLTDTGILVLK
jgi:ATP-dependent DNA helicase RecG